MPTTPSVVPKIERQMPASPHAISSMTMGSSSPVGSAKCIGHEIERGTQADLGRLLDDRPGGLLALVPLVGHGPHGVLGKVVDPLLDLDLVLVEIEEKSSLPPASGTVVTTR